MRRATLQAGMQAGLQLCFTGWCGWCLVACGAGPARGASTPAGVAPAQPAAAASGSGDAVGAREATERGPSPARTGGQRPASGAQEQLDAARKAVLSLGRAAWNETRPKSAQALEALADLLSAADQRQAATEHVSTLREQAARLDGADPPDDFAHVDSIATGLSSALVGLEALQLAEPGALLPWVSAAREAIAGLRQGATTPALRGTTVQDSFRATLDAFQAAVLATQGGGAAAGSPAASMAR